MSYTAELARFDACAVGEKKSPAGGADEKRLSSPATFEFLMFLPLLVKASRDMLLPMSCSL